MSHEPIRATPQERYDNPRSKSATLRWVRRALTARPWCRRRFGHAITIRGRGEMPAAFRHQLLDQFVYRDDMVDAIGIGAAGGETRVHVAAIGVYQGLGDAIR